MTFGSRLKQLRESNGYTMDKLIEIYNKQFCGKMNKSTLSRYENGLQEPMYIVVKNLANLFCVSVDYLSGNAECVGSKEKRKDGKAMAKCKICGERVSSGEVIHTGCREEKAHTIMGVICDKYCKYPDLCRDADALDKFCDNCEVADLLGCE